MTRFFLFSVFFLTILIPKIVLYADESELINLGTLDDIGIYSLAESINESGVVVGSSRMADTGYYHPFVWDNGTMRDLYTNTFQSEFAFSINNSSKIALDHAILDNDTVVNIGSLGTGTVRINAINDLGHAVGGANLPQNQGHHAFIWKNNTMIDLGTLGGDFSQAYDINNLDQVVGKAETASGEKHAFLWQDGMMIDLGTLGGTRSCANAINDFGQIVGDFSNSSGSHAFLWQNDEMIDIGTIHGHASIAHGINNIGQIVGVDYELISDGMGGFITIPHAFIWENGVMTNLDSFIPQQHFFDRLECAYDINDTGQVVGSGIKYLNTYAFLLTMGYIDADNDDMADEWEAENGLDNTVNDASADADNDGLTNFFEWQQRTSPNNKDTDSDGYNDYHECQAGTNPLDTESYFGIINITEEMVSGLFNETLIQWNSILGKRYTIWVKSNSIGSNFVVLHDNYLAESTRSSYRDQGGGPNNVDHPYFENNSPRLYKITLKE